MTHRWIRAVTLLALWQALQRLGLDMATLERSVGAPPRDPQEAIPVDKYLALWDNAQRLYPGSCLPTALALEVPLGAFGMMDYLAASAATLGGACESLMAHSRMVSEDTGVEVHTTEGLVWLTVRADDHVPPSALEFTLAVLVLRLRQLVDTELQLQTVWLPTPMPRDTKLHQQVFAAPIQYAAPVASLALQPQDLQRPLQRADAGLHRLLEQLTAQLAVGSANHNGLELALRARLRAALPQGQANPAALARLLGLSERTLQRRLAQDQRSFATIVQEFQREEALRLLSHQRLGLAQIAASLGYAEQTSFTRAFKRWTGTTPALWRAAHTA